MTMDSYDVIVLGTGHNGLVLQAYLARCGLRTLSIDRAAVPGGGLATVEDPRHPGFRHNTHSFFHRAITAMPWFADLELARHGVRYIEPPLNVSMLMPGGQVIEWWTDVARTIEGFARFSQRDADTLRRFVEEFRPIVQHILIPEAQSPPLEPARRIELLNRSKHGRRLLEIQAMSPLEFVTRHFEHDAVRAGLLFFNGLREVDLRLKGFGHAIPAILAGKHLAQMAIGGSAALARGLIADITEHGGRILCAANIESLIVEGGRVTGVATFDGSRFTARAIVSGLNPTQTFVDLLPANAVPAAVREAAQRFEYNLLAPLFALNLTLKEPPRYPAFVPREGQAHPFMTIMGLERFETFHDIVRAHEAGAIPPTVMWGTCPTVFDPSQAPPDRHVAFMWEKLPYRLNNDPASWDTHKDEHGRAMLDLWKRHAPNLTDENVIDSFTRSPLDTERTLPNMRFGDLLVGSFANGQIGFNRPFAGAGRYRTPIAGLYLCGGSTHPGGNVTGLCGYNAARVVATDLNASVWWQPPDAEQSIARL